MLINPLSSAGYLSEKLRLNNINTIAVYTNLDGIEDYIRPSKDLFDEQIHFKDASLEDIYTKINVLQIDYIINGADQTVQLTDQLAAKFNSKYTNNSLTSYLRQNKYHQQQALLNAGMPAIKQVKMNRYQLNHVILKNMTYPIFAKPLNGAATIGAFKASSYEELITKLADQPTRIFLEDINEYLFQEYITGTELFIDTFSINSTHLVSGIYTYKKDLIDEIPVYRYIEVTQEQDIIDSLSNFTKKALDAVEMRNGFAHTEVFYNQSEIKLIEINPRISGAAGQINELGKLVGLIPQDEYLVYLLTNQLNVSNMQLNKPKKYARLIFLYDHREVDVSKLITYHSCIAVSNTPIDLTASITLADVRKLVLLTSPNLESLETDTQHLIENDII